MKHLLSILAACALSLSCWSCDPDEPVLDNTETEEPGGNDDNGGSTTDSTEVAATDIIVTIGSRSFPATLEDNTTARAFAALLPMTATMAELNGNEKYYSLSQSLPTNTYRPGTISNGDIMLYGSSTVVLFYETFSSGYNYSRIGKITNPDGLASAVGSGSVSVTFSVAQSD